MLVLILTLISVLLINPEILELSGRQEVREGCLSFPGKFETVERANRVTVRYLNTQGVELTQTFNGLAAAVILHEYEHLLGITFLEKGSSYKIETDKKIK